MRRALVAVLATSALLVGEAVAESSPATAEATLDGFHAALAAGDREGALARLDAAVVIFESGGAELSRAEYERHHLAADMEFAAATTTERVDRRSGAEADFAWILTRSTTRGTIRDREVSTVGVETALLVHAEEGWRIIHLHWSSAARP